VPIPNNNIPNFAQRALSSVRGASTSLRFAETRESRILRRFSTREVSEFLGVGRAFITNMTELPNAPQGQQSGRERTFSVDEIMRLRSIAAGRPNAKKPMLHWRKPGDPLPILTVASQKGGTGKSLTSAHIAHAAHHIWGLRVGLLDADPQATASQYFVGNANDIGGFEVPVFTKFMGVPEARQEPLIHTDQELDAFWQKTAWPGLRLMPGGFEIQDADISMHFLAQGKDPRFKKVYRLLRDAIDRWSRAHPPVTQPSDLVDEDGSFNEDLYQKALYETLDLIIIDTAPSLTLSQLNAVVAADALLIPQTMKGFDLSTLQVYLSSLSDYLSYVKHEDSGVNFASKPSYILPTIVGGGTDIEQVAELYAHDPDITCPVVFKRSDAVANSAQKYQSIFEYSPEKSRRKSAEMFQKNALAVAEAILTRTVDGLPSRGFANNFLIENFGEGTLPAWTEEAA
jgi:chromosome partitioning protein